MTKTQLARAHHIPQRLAKRAPWTTLRQLALGTTIQDVQRFWDCTSAQALDSSNFKTSHVVNFYLDLMVTLFPNVVVQQGSLTHKTFEKRRFLLQIVNIRNYHWVLMVYAGRSCWCIDSLPSGRDREGLNLSSMHQFRGTLVVNNQGSTNDCALYAMTHLTLLARHARRLIGLLRGGKIGAETFKNEMVSILQAATPDTVDELRHWIQRQRQTLHLSPDGTTRVGFSTPPLLRNWSGWFLGISHNIPDRQWKPEF